MELGQGDRAGRSVGRPTDAGYAMAALLVGLSIMAVLMTMALPVWSHMIRREKEAELIWRGEQYARAIGLFQRRYANTFPPSVDVLVEQRFLRKKYKDPITNDDFQIIPAGGVAPGQGQGQGQGGRGQGPGQGGPVQGGIGGVVQGNPGGASPQQTIQVGGAQMQRVSGPVQGIGIQGVASKSTATSIKIYNGRTKYNEWVFIYLATSRGISGPQGTPPPGQGNNPRSPFGGVPPPGFPGRPPIPNQPPFGPGGQPPFGPGGGFGRPGGPPGQPGQPGQPQPFPPRPFGPPGQPSRPPGR
jgi:type II secretory pathway pseudopilin PulG